jgi:hypothetical protein
MAKCKRLGKPKIFYDRQVKMWVIIDKDSGIATQAETKTLLKECFIDALRAMCATYRDIYAEGRKP